MPHITLEYSSNVSESSQLPTLLLELSQIAAELGEIRLENFKSRAYIANDYVIGNGAAGAAFVGIVFKMLEGRTDDPKQRIGAALLQRLEQWFEESAKTLDLQITVEILDIQRDSYFKYPAGTFTPQ